MKPKRVCEIFLRFQLPITIPIHFHSFKTTIKCPFYSPSSYHLPRLILFFLFKKVVRTSILNIWIENYVRGKKEPLMIQIRLLKRTRRDVKVDPKLGGQWNVPSLVANGMFQCLVANGRWRKNTFSHFPTPPQQILLKPSIFSFDLKVSLYHGSRPLFTHFLPFPWSINYNYASQCNKSSTPSLSIWFWLKIWFFSSLWNYGVAHGHILWAPSRTSEWRTASEVISRFDPNPTSSWWKTWTSKGARSSWSWTPLSLVLSYFSELSHPGDLVASRPRFWKLTWNRLWRLLWN
jgi:hypothetical protein